MRNKPLSGSTRRGFFMREPTPVLVHTGYVDEHGELYFWKPAIGFSSLERSE